LSDNEQQPSEAAPQPEERRLELPAWVPAAIGLTLILLAAMAVWTGFRTQVRPHEEQPAAEVTPFTETDGLFLEESGGPPGAPGPGASRVRPEGDVPAPGPLGEARTEGLAISGDADGVSGRKTLAVRRGLVFDVTPADAVVYVNDVAVGSVRQFDSPESAYEFADEGVFSVKVTAPGFAEVELVVTAGPDEAAETAVVTLRLEKSR
jgi:hypothetical protein